MRQFLICIFACVTAGATYTTTPPRAAKRKAVEKAAESARDGAAEMIRCRVPLDTHSIMGIVAVLLSERCFYPTKADGSEKPPRKIIIELPAAPSSGQAAAPAEDDEEQPDVITN